MNVRSEVPMLCVYTSIPYLYSRKMASEPRKEGLVGLRLSVALYLLHFCKLIVFFVFAIISCCNLQKNLT